MKKITTIILLLLSANLLAQIPGDMPPPPSCSRAELMQTVEAYIAAQEAGDISKLALSDEASFHENMIEVKKADGLWNTALPVAFSRSIYDDTRCKTFSEVIVTEGDHQYVIGTRLAMNDGKVTAIDSLVTDEGDWLFNANAYLKYSKMETWQKPMGAEKTPAQDLIDAANRYLDVFADKFVELPWGTPCARLEGGLYTNRDNKPDASCNIGVPPGLLYIVNRNFIVDEEAGVVNVFCRFGNSTSGMPDSHTFHMIDGKFRHVHTISVNLTDNPSPQADDNGNIIRNAQ